MTIRLKLIYKLAPPVDVEAPASCTFGQLKVNTARGARPVVRKPAEHCVYAYACILHKHECLGMGLLSPVTGLT